MSKLITENHFSDADAFYAALTDAHRELSTVDSERLNARLILLLANHIGDKQVLLEALDIAAQLEQ
ncbi:DUF2783 domain-containing protein [uncultured Pseudoteredinibacter sp.]|uniref:DUF2783 domain-containing protein n=1 Tax=uncultured Pseudoteredinibacter sp. TaxID=1641701 RepID=UPI0026339D6D|nr:DUF2783 domain-containing protein [uncultured Pseudoteredinibacter sp.]